MTTRHIESSSAAVYVHDETYGWVLVNDDFPTRDEAERFASLITEFERFNASVSPVNVMVSTSPPQDNAPDYESVYAELSAVLQAGIRKALSEYVEIAQDTREIEAL